MQSVNGVLTSPATVGDKDGKRGKRQGAVSAATEWSVQQPRAGEPRSSTAAKVSLQRSRALPVLTLSLLWQMSGPESHNSSQ